MLPEIKTRFKIIEELPTKILQSEQRVSWIVERGVESIDKLNIRRAMRHYLAGLDKFRPSLKEFRAAWAAVQSQVAGAASEGCRSAETVNQKVAEIEEALGTARLSRVVYQPHTLPSLGANRLDREGVLSALDSLISQLG